eukprot:7385720-Prymnesium_polylepis.3
MYWGQDRGARTMYWHSVVPTGHLLHARCVIVRLSAARRIVCARSASEQRAVRDGRAVRGMAPVCADSYAGQCARPGSADSGGCASIGMADISACEGASAGVTARVRVP